MMVHAIVVRRYLPHGQVVVLGDMVDIGPKSKQNLLALMRLSQHPKWGGHLTVMMGNHEAAMFDLGVPFDEDPKSFYDDEGQRRRVSVV